MLSLVGKLYHDLPGGPEDNAKVSMLSDVVRQELCVLGMLGLAAYSNVRAGFHLRVLATDASGYGLGAVTALISHSLHRFC